MAAPVNPPHLLHAFPTFRVGGAQVRFAAIANHFGRAFRHTLVAMDGQYDCQERLEPGLQFERLDPLIRKGDTLANVREFRRALRATRPDTLVTYNWGSIEWAMANWPRLAHHIHIEDGFGTEEAQRQFRRRIWTRRIVLSRSVVIVPSLNLQTIATQVWKLDPRRVHYIPNGIDCARFAGPRDPTLAATWAGNGPVIGTVAALRREKNIERLLRAFQRVLASRPCRLVIVGDGPERGTLEQLALDLGIAKDVTFAGHLANPEQVYQALDIFALSSDTEQMPYGIIEAMAAGLPIAATDVGDIRHMLADENLPFVVPPNDELLGEGLGKLLVYTECRRSIGKANRAKAQREYGQERMFATYRGFFLGNQPLAATTDDPRGDTSVSGHSPW